MRKLIAVVMAAGMIGGFAGQGGAAAPKKVFTDPAGDAGNQDAGAPGFSEAGLDLVGGTITKKGANLEFTVLHASMPPAGSFPEGARFLWAFMVNSKSEYRIVAKSADIGKPDAVAGNGTERVGKAGLDHFRLETCVHDASLPVGLVNCTTIEYITGKFNPAAKSFTAIVPLKTIKAKTGSVITGSGGDGAQICQICWITHVAERSFNTTRIDGAGQTVAFKVPKK